MDESSIKQKLAETVKSFAPEPTVQQNEEPVAPEVFHNNLPLDNFILQNNVMDILGVPRMQRSSTESQDKVNAIVRWAADNSPSSEMTDIIETIMRQERLMGIHLQEDRINRLYSFVRLAEQRSLIELRMKALNG